MGWGSGGSGVERQRLVVVVVVLSCFFISGPDSRVPHREACEERMYMLVTREKQANS